MRAPQFTLSASPVTLFGGAGGDPAFDLTNVVDVALLDDGGIAAASRGAGVMIFGRQGEGVRTIGRRGTGPGEFGNARMVRLAADTLLMVDLGNLRISRLLPDRRVLSSESLVERLPAPTGRPIGQFPGGTVLLASAGSWSVLPGKALRGQSESKLVLLRAGAKGKVIGTVPDVEIVTVETRQGGVKAPLLDQVRFGLRAHLALWDTLIATGDGASYRINLRTSTGRLVGAIEVDVPRVPVSRAQRQANLELELATFDANAKHSQIPVEARRLIAEAPYATSLPALGKFFVTPTGTLWVLDGMTQFDTTWAATAFRRDGAILGRLKGGGGAPIAFGNDVVLIKGTDADGVVRFEMRRIRKS